MPNRYTYGRTLRERLYARLIPNPETGCVLWIGETSQGYGRILINGKKRPVHRVVWELENGPIPPGLTIDHVKARGCRHRNCANLAHLEPVTLRENLMRSNAVSAIAAAKTHCPQGHPYDEANTYHRPDGGRTCRICARIFGRQNKRNQRARKRRDQAKEAKPS